MPDSNVPQVTTSGNNELHEGGAVLSALVTGFPKHHQGVANLHTPWPRPPAGLVHVQARLPGSSEVKATTGLFPAGTKTRTVNDLAAVDCVGLDADAADWLSATDPATYKGSKEAKARMHALSVDDPDALNTLLHAHRNVVLSFLHAAGFPAPTRTVHSGYGLHSWWHFDRAVFKSDPDWHTVRAVSGVMIDKVNAWAGFNLFDPAAKDLGTRLLSFPGAYNLKGRAKRLILTSGYSNTVLTVNQVEDWVGIHKSVDPITGRVKKSRPAALSLSERGAVVYCDLATIAMKDGRSLLAWVNDLNPGEERTGCPSPVGETDPASLTLHHEVGSHPWARWVHDFGSGENLVHSDGAGPRTGGGESEDDVLAGIVPPKLIRIPTKPTGDNLPGDAVLDDDPDGVMVGLQPGQANPGVKLRLIENPEDRASEVAASILEARAPQVPDTTTGAYSASLDAMVDEALGMPGHASGAAAAALERFTGLRRSLFCSRAGLWSYGAKNEGDELKGSRLACMSLRCQDCGPTLLAATAGATRAILESVFRLPTERDWDRASWLQWDGVILPDLNDPKTLQRWADGAPHDRHFFTIHTSATTSQTLVFYRRAGGHRPQPSKTKPSQLSARMADAVEYQLPTFRHWLLNAIQTTMESIDPAAWGRAKRVHVISGRAWLVGAITSLRDALLKRKGKPEEDRDPNETRAVSYMPPKEVRAKLEGIGGHTMHQETTTRAIKLGVTVAQHVRIGTGVEAAPVGPMFKVAVRTGTIPTIRRKAARAVVANDRLEGVEWVDVLADT